MTQSRDEDRLAAYDWRPASPFHGRGVAYALLAIPLAVVSWMLLWQLGIMSSFVVFGATIVAVLLYRYGSRGELTASGVVAIALIVVAAVAVSLVFSFLADAAALFPLSEVEGSVYARVFDAVGNPEFGPWFTESWWPSSTVWEAWIPNLILAVLYLLIGLVPTLTLAWFGINDRVSRNGLLIGGTVVLGVLGVITFVVGPWRLDLPPSASDLAVVVPSSGECLEEPDNDSGYPPRVDCAEPHWGEVIQTGPVADESLTDYPGIEWVQQAAMDQCAETWAQTIGVPIDQTTLTVFTYVPSEVSWAQGDRTLTCIALDPDGPTTGTLGGSAR